MKKIVKYIGISAIVILELALIGCSLVPDMITPAWIEPAAIAYADANVPGFLPYTTLHDAKQVSLKMDYVHLIRQITIERDLHDEKLTYDFLANQHSLYLAEAESLKSALFDPGGPLGLILSAAGVGTLALYTTKPGHKKELEKARHEGFEEGKNGGA